MNVGSICLHCFVGPQSIHWHVGIYALHRASGLCTASGRPLAQGKDLAYIAWSPYEKVCAASDLS